MGILQPYKGVYYSASSAREKLDIDSILAGCDAVDEEANHISEYANQFSVSSAALDVNTLSVNNLTMAEKAQEYSDGINQVEIEIMSVTAKIREAVEYAYNSIQDSLNIEAQTRDQREINYRRNSR